MQRQAAIAALVAERADAITITTEQAIGAWRAAVLEPANQIPDHLDIVGCMGSASTIGLGIALAQPDRKVIVVDGDGSLLMQLGSLVTIAGVVGPREFPPLLQARGRGIGRLRRLTAGTRLDRRRHSPRGTRR